MKKVGKSGEKWGIFCNFACKKNIIINNAREIFGKHRGKD